MGDYCCEPLEFVVSEVPVAQRDGLMAECSINLETGKAGPCTLVLHFRRGRKRHWINILHCPFCGKDLAPTDRSDPDGNG